MPRQFSPNRIAAEYISDHIKEFDRSTASSAYFSSKRSALVPSSKTEKAGPFSRFFSSDIVVVIIRGTWLFVVK